MRYADRRLQPDVRRGLLGKRLGPDGFRKVRTGSSTTWPTRSARRRAPDDRRLRRRRRRPATSRARRTHKGLSVVFAVDDENADERIEHLIAAHSRPEDADRRLVRPPHPPGRDPAQGPVADRRRRSSAELDARKRRKPAEPASRRAATASGRSSPEESAYWLDEFRDLADEPRDPRGLRRRTTGMLTDAEIAEIEREIEREFGVEPEPGRSDARGFAAWVLESKRPGLWYNLAPGRSRAASGTGQRRPIPEGRRSMKVHEYQAKELLKAAGVAVPEGIVVTKPEEAAAAYDALGGGLIVVKAQVHAGRPRQGGRRRPRGRPRRGPGDRQRTQAPARRAWPRACSSSARARTPSRPPPSLLGKTLVTYQTGAEGQAISKVLVTVGHDIARELYLGLAVDRGLAVPGADGLDRGGRRDRDRRPARRPRRSTASRSTSASASADFQARKVCKALGPHGRDRQEGRGLLQAVRPALHRQGRLARRDQPADRDRGGRRPGARLQAELRRQRPVPPPRRRRDARRDRGRPRRAPGRPRAA